LGRPPLTQTEVPGNLVRDLGLPAFSRRAQSPRGLSRGPQALSQNRSLCVPVRSSRTESCIDR
jgi:hypothetical protein